MSGSSTRDPYPAATGDPGDLSTHTAQVPSALASDTESSSLGATLPPQKLSGATSLGSLQTETEDEEDSEAAGGGFSIPLPPRITTETENAATKVAAAGTSELAPASPPLPNTQERQAIAVAEPERSVRRTIRFGFGVAPPSEVGADAE